MKNRDTREVMMVRVFNLLLRKGYDAVSITDIQQETGLSRGLLYHYFGSKDQLFVEATAKFFLEIFNIDLPTIERFDIPRMITYMADRYRAVMTPEVSVMDYDFLFYRVIRESEQFAAKYRSMREHEQAAWRIVVENSLKQGDLRSGVDVESSARSFVYLMDGVWMNAVNDNSSQMLIKNLRNTLNDYYRLLRR